MSTPDIAFTEFPKIARLSREAIVTEKIDGTNGQIFIGPEGEFLVGSRTRWITPDQDNHGFARWAYEHRDELVAGLGVGRHYGEFWGSGIQRGYGLPKGEKRFSLFNVTRWCEAADEPLVIPSLDPRAEVKYQQKAPACCHIVPVLWRGEFNTVPVIHQLEKLRCHGSVAAPGFMNPEGVVVFHTAGNFGFKKTLTKDEAPKSLTIL